MNTYNGFPGPQRSRALRWLKAEVAAGRRQPAGRWCDVCGQTEGVLEAHSEDYSEPFGDHIGRWTLCYRCHMIVHCRFRCPKAWQYYLSVLAAGRRFQALLTRDWPAFARQHLRDQDAPTEPAEPPPAGFAALLAEGEAAEATQTGQDPLFPRH